MLSPHLPGPHGYIIATKMSLFLLLFCWVAQFFPTTQERRNPSISIQSPVQLLNNSLPLFNNLFVNQPNSYQLIPYFVQPNSYQLIPYFVEPNSYQLMPYFVQPNSFQLFQNNNSIQASQETPPLKNTSEQTVLYLFLRLQDIFVDFENETIENEIIQNNIERNIILNQINSFLIYSI